MARGAIKCFHDIRGGEARKMSSAWVPKWKTQFCCCAFRAPNMKAVAFLNELLLQGCSAGC